MDWKKLETAFLHAWGGAFSKGKWFICFCTLSLCGVLAVFCRALSVESSPWVYLSLLFLPGFISSSFLLIFGVFCVRTYEQEKRGTVVGMARMARGCVGTAVGTSYFAFPPILIYLLLWVMLGFFFLLKEIPLLGPFFNVVFAFGPFLLIFCSLILCLFNVVVLFFIVPAATHQSVKTMDFVYRTGHSIRAQPFLAGLLLFIACLPALLIGGILTLAAVIANTSFSLGAPTPLLALEWFFVMLPFCGALAPAVLFFFHFAAESYQILKDLHV